MEPADTCRLFRCEQGGNQGVQQAETQSQTESSSARDPPSRINKARVFGDVNPVLHMVSFRTSKSKKMSSRLSADLCLHSMARDALASDNT